MTKHISIALGERTFKVPRLTLGQQENLIELFAEPQQDCAGQHVHLFRLLLRTMEIVLARAEPKIEDMKALECSAAEFATARDKIFAFSGMAKGIAEEAEPKNAA